MMCHARAYNFVFNSRVPLLHTLRRFEVTFVGGSCNTSFSDCDRCDSCD